MKNSLFSIFLFIILLGFLTYTDISFKEENFEKAMNIYNLIEDKGKLAAIYVNHLDYDVMLNEALKLTVYIERDDYGESDASLHLLKSSTEHMKELQVPNIENIF